MLHAAITRDRPREGFSWYLEVTATLWHLCHNIFQVAREPTRVSDPDVWLNTGCVSCQYALSSLGARALGSGRLVVTPAPVIAHNLRPATVSRRVD